MTSNISIWINLELSAKTSTPNKVKLLSGSRLKFNWDKASLRLVHFIKSFVEIWFPVIQSYGIILTQKQSLGFVNSKFFVRIPLHHKQNTKIHLTVKIIAEANYLTHVDWNYPTSPVNLKVVIDTYDTYVSAQDSFPVILNLEDLSLIIS